jgi:MFS family permease
LALPPQQGRHVTGAARADSRTLTTLILIGIANHSVLSGSRVVVALDALSMGASPFTVGVLISLYALLPMFLSIAVGRLVDRIGARRPMVVGSVLIGVGATLPFALPGMPSLFGSAVLLGVGFMAFQIAAQNTTGELGGPATRSRDFSLLALGYSVSGFLGPLCAGFAIDHFGFRATFATFALVPLIPLAVLASGRLALPGPHPPVAGAARHAGVLALLRHRTLRYVFAINALLSLGWDLHTIFVPVYGAKIGLSASEIGGVLSSFAAATFVVRLFMPAIARRLREHQVLAAALVVAGVVFLAFPFSQSVLALLALSFALGLGLGAGQPMVLSLLHAHAPAGHVGEAVGVRMSLVNSMAFAAPILLGAIGASVGIVPVFWSVGASLAAAGYLARREGR